MAKNQNNIAEKLYGIITNEKMEAESDDDE